jgi:NifU-like domain
VEQVMDEQAGMELTDDNVEQVGALPRVAALRVCQPQATQSAAELAGAAMPAVFDIASWTAAVHFVAARVVAIQYCCNQSGPPANCAFGQEDVGRSAFHVRVTGATACRTATAGRQRLCLHLPRSEISKQAMLLMQVLDEIRPYLIGTGGGGLEHVGLDGPICKVRITGPAAKVRTETNTALPCLSCAFWAFVLHVRAHAQAAA